MPRRSVGLTPLRVRSTHPTLLEAMRLDAIDDPSGEDPHRSAKLAKKTQRGTLWSE